MSPGDAAGGAVLLRLVTAQVCLHAGMAGLRMAAPLLALRQGQRPLAVGFLLALFALSQVFLSLPAGRYVDRHGLRRPVALGVAAAIGGGLLAVFWPIYPVLCLSALLSGGATGLSAIALQRHVGRLAHDPGELRSLFGWLSIGPAVSNVIGPLLAGLLIDHAGRQAGDAQGFQAAFGLLVVLPLASRWVLQGVAELPAPSATSAAPSPARHLLRDARLRQLLLVNWLLSSCWDVHTFMVPVLGHERDLSASVIGLILGLFAASATLVRLLLPLVAKHLQERLVITAAMLLTALLFGIYPLTGSALGMGLCSAVLGLVLGSVQPMIMSTLHQITPAAQHGAALGLRMMAINASSVLMPLLFGSAGALLGVSVVFWSVGALVGLGAHAAWQLRP